MRKKTFKESSLRDLLRVPQKPKHHPEGDVDRHSMMVRHSLRSAIEAIREKKLSDPDGPFQHLDLNFTPSEMNILRFAGMLHDIGKGQVLDPATLSAHGHEQPENFEKAMVQLGPSWKAMYDQADSSDKEDLWFIITNHMTPMDENGFKSKKLRKQLMDEEGKFFPDRRVKLLLVLLLMDRMGRGGESKIPWRGAKEFARSNRGVAEETLDAMSTGATIHAQEFEKSKKQNRNQTSDDPQEFVQQLKNAGREDYSIKLALKSKFGLGDDKIKSLLGENVLNFRLFFESEESGREIKGRLPLSEDVFVLSRVFSENGKKLYVVGGANRDYLRHFFSDSGKPFDASKTKDVDLTTDATPQEVVKILTKAGIRVIPKGEEWGVISAILNGEEYEIATFREDLGYSDGRRPDEVRWADIDTDHKRRDLTMNAIYYKIPESKDEAGTFIDPSGGQGFEDIKSWKVRVIGDPFERIGEDKLRIARIPRFHAYYNKGNILDVLDDDTKAAIEKYKDLRGFGVSPERIQQEFLSGLKKAADITSYLENYKNLDLLKSVFPGLEVDLSNINRLKRPEIRSAGGNEYFILVLSYLLRNNPPEKLRSRLNELKYPNVISDSVSFLLKVWRAIGNSDFSEIIKLASDFKNKAHYRSLVEKSISIVGDMVDGDRLFHFSRYELPVIQGNTLGISPGPEVGKEIERRKIQHYEDSFRLNRDKF